MAAKTGAKNETKSLERTYNIPLRREFQKAPCWNRSKRAVTAVRGFLRRHMKSDSIKLGKSLNEHIWKHGIKNPPHHVKVTAVKDEKGEVRAELFGAAEKVARSAAGRSAKAQKTAAEEKVVGNDKDSGEKVAAPPGKDVQDSTGKTKMVK